MTREDVYEALVEAEALAAAVARSQNENRRTLALAYAGAVPVKVAWTPPHDSVRSRLATAGVDYDEWRRAKARPWLTPRERRYVDGRIGVMRRIKQEGLPRPAPPRAARRAVGAGPWPKLARRTERSRHGVA